MNEVCEWFEQYIDNKDNVLVFKFSDGTVKKAELGAYLTNVNEGIAYQVGYCRGLEAGRKGEQEIDEQEEVDDWRDRLDELEREEYYESKYRKEQE